MKSSVVSFRIPQITNDKMIPCLLIYLQYLFASNIIHNINCLNQFENEYMTLDFDRFSKEKNGTSKDEVIKCACL